ncbi:MAG: hypothetical protein H8E57_09565 [Candidatus Cloacimonetes bacterium]|nr:hypothetical protein [Candidatus Cloacimonadota bacterium]
MKFFKLIIIFILLLSFLAACGQKAEVKEEMSKETKVEEVKVPADTVQAEVPVEEKAKKAVGN